MKKLKNSDVAIEVFSDELINLHRGQGLDLYWRDTLTCPTESEYLGMVSNKTGGLFRLAARLLQSQSPHFDEVTRNCARDCIPLVTLLGLIFQICDDYLNLQSNKYKAQKGMCEDLSEGKFSFPIIHSIHAAAQVHEGEVGDRQLMNILKLKTQDEELKKHAVNLMQETKSFEYTREFVHTLTEKADRFIQEYEHAQWGDNGYLKDLLAKISAI